MRVAPQIAQVFCKRSMNEKDPARDHVRRLGNASLAGVRRETLPKQFIPLVGERSTFQTTMQMLEEPVFEKPIIISNKDYRFLLADQLREIDAEADIILEPSRAILDRRWRLLQV